MMRVKNFKVKIKEQLGDWRQKLTALKAKGKKTVVWGGGSKSVGFLTNFADIDVIEYVVDINPHMENNFIPGIGKKYVQPKLDDSGDRKDGTATAHVGRQYLGRYGKTDNGVVTVTTVWADERVYYPVHAVPYTPAKYFAKGKNDPEFRTKLVIGAELAVRARAAGFTFRAVVADSAYGDQDGFRAGLAEAGLPFVMALRPHRGTWARAADAHTPVDAAGPWPGAGRTTRATGRRSGARSATGTRRPGGPPTRSWADGDRTAPGAWSWPPPTRPPCRARPPGTWSRTCPVPAAPARPGSPHPAASLAEIVRLYAIRNWIEQSYKQVKDELGWADFQVRSDLAIRRHQALVNCAFSFCWDAWFADQPDPSQPAAPQPGPGRRERGASRRTAGAILAAGAARSPRLARPVDHAAALVDRLVQSASAPAAASPDQLGRGRLRPAPLHPELTDYR